MVTGYVLFSRSHLVIHLVYILCPISNELLQKCGGYDIISIEHRIRIQDTDLEKQEVTKMSANMEILWLVGMVAFIILEAVTYQLISIWFVIGAIGGLIAAMCGANFYVQMGVFLAVAILLLVLLRPVSMKLIKKQDFKSNADSLIGKSILITEEVNNIKGTGQGKVNGMVWTVRSSTDATFEPGDLAVIKSIEGVKLIVEK